KINEKFSDAHTNLSAVYLIKKEWDLAITEARSAIADIFYATPELAYFNMGEAFYGKADYLKAEENFKKAIELNPRYWVAYNDLGLTYMKMNKYKQASDILKLAINNVPNYIDAHYNLGLVLIKLKDKKDALNAFQEVIRLAPDSEMAMSAKGYMELLK
ncbi:MAG: tetratricopeptide repeat protein, partial [Deltaproteobacteria bacterium]